MTWYPFGDIQQKPKLLTIMLFLGGLLTITPDIRAGEIVVTAQQKRLEKFAGSSGWNDPDMLEVS